MVDFDEGTHIYRPARVNKKQEPAQDDARLKAGDAQRGILAFPATPKPLSQTTGIITTIDIGDFTGQEPPGAEATYGPPKEARLDQRTLLYVFQEAPIQAIVVLGYETQRWPLGQRNVYGKILGATEIAEVTLIEPTERDRIREALRAHLLEDRTREVERAAAISRTYSGAEIPNTILFVRRSEDLSTIVRGGQI